MTVHIQQKKNDSDGVKVGDTDAQTKKTDDYTLYYIMTEIVFFDMKPAV